MRVKVAQFKFWPNPEIRSAWRGYIFAECTETNNINALYIGLKLLQKVTEEFMARQMDNLHKKQKKQDKQSNGGPYGGSASLKDSNNQNGKGGVVVRKEKPNYKQYFESESDEEDES
jgi:hypothetical protein